MQPTSEIDQFVESIVNLPEGPGTSLDDALKPCIEQESELRKLFATDRQNARLDNPHVGLVDVFQAPPALRTTRARVVADPTDLTAKYVMPLAGEIRRKEGAPCMVNDLDEFKKNWAIFTEGSLSQLIDWNNVVAAGGSVLACLTPLSEGHSKSKRAMRKFYHNTAYPTSDVDLFLWGLDAKQAEAKINAIYEAVRDSVPWEVTCIRTKHTVSIHCQYPYRSVQIVLRLYRSPAEILAGFDIDAPCCAYDGNRVWANPRAVVAMMRQCNTVDMSRRSPSYEVRLSKYASRGYEVYVPSLSREEVDPTIYERSIAKMEGLARLLVLEKLIDTNTRYAFLESRRVLRARPSPVSRYSRRRSRKYKGDLKQDLTVAGLEMNDYDVATLHIPYGPGWDARRIDKLVYQTDLGMNSTFNPKNKGRRLHRHPAFFGTMEECLEDCCEQCPTPVDDDERKLQDEESDHYIRGRIQFIEENPGRQMMTGSFNPIDVGEWSEQVYIKPVQKFFAAIASGDKAAVQRLISEGIDVHQRDHVGRSPLHVAIICKQEGIACNLVDAGARMIARLADGRTAFHLAAQFDQATLTSKMFERSAKNKAESEAKNPKEVDDQGDQPMEKLSSEDDWSSHDDDDVDMDADEEEEEEDDGSDDDDDSDEDRRPKKAQDQKADASSPPEDLPEDEDDEPDVIDVNQLDWDTGFSALIYAVLFGSLSLIDVLLANEADPKLASNPGTRYDASPLHPLAACILRSNEEEACSIAERLIRAGATSSTANNGMQTILHQVVMAGKAKLLSAILQHEAAAASVLNFPSVSYNQFTFPISTAISKGHYAVVVVLLAFGVNLELDEAEASRAVEIAREKRHCYMSEMKNYLELATQPVEVALAQWDDIAQVLIALGARVDVGLKNCVSRYSDETSRRTYLDWVDYAIASLTHQIENSDVVVVSVAEAIPEAIPEDLGNAPRWTAFLEQYKSSLERQRPVEDPAKKKEAEEEAEEEKRENLLRLQDSKQYLLEVRKYLAERGAKTWKEVYPDIASTAKVVDVTTPTSAPVPWHSPNDSPKRKYLYGRYTNDYNLEYTAEHQQLSYDELFEACYTGDNSTVERLCLPADDNKRQSTNLLNINVIALEQKDSLWNPTKNYSPLFAAIAGRHWSTAKLVVAISAAQYSPKEDADKLKWDASDSDANSECSDDSDDTIEKPDFNFVDIAMRNSAIKCSIHPRKMLQRIVPYLVGQKSGYADILQKTIFEEDFAAFVQVLDLHQSVPRARGESSIQPSPLQFILNGDLPDFLDEYIRRTGCGIDVKGAQKEVGGSDIPVAVNDNNKLYLGLNVHGKKRADLARKNDPDAHLQNTQESVLLWDATRVKATKIIAYLASDKPHAAYRFYAMSHSDTKAIWLRRAPELEKVLPTLLGWKVTELGESPLAAAVLSGDLDTFKAILVNAPPQLVSSALHKNTKFTGMNLLQIAIAANAKMDLVDFLMSRNISPLERDSTQGWNIYHFLAWHNRGDLVEYFLGKLPRDINEALLGHESKAQKNTPLHIAVSKGLKRIVRLFLHYLPASAIKRNIDGHIPLHLAVRTANPEVIQILVDRMDGDALRMENSVGDTPWDIISRRELKQSTSNHHSTINSGSAQLDPKMTSPPGGRYYNPDDTIERTRLLKTTISELVQGGRLTGQPRIASEFNNLATVAEMRAIAVKERREARAARKPKTQEKENIDGCDYVSIDDALENLVSALDEKPGLRQLVHLTDVQKSVASSLTKASAAGRSMKEKENAKGEGLDEEEEADQEKSVTPSHSSLFSYILMGIPTGGEV